MLILAGNDVGGAVTALRRVLEAAAWGACTATSMLRFVAFADVGLARDASDRTVWYRCQYVHASDVQLCPHYGNTRDNAGVR